MPVHTSENTSRPSIPPVPYVKLGPRFSSFAHTLRPTSCPPRVGTADASVGVEGTGDRSPVRRPNQQDGFPWFQSSPAWVRFHTPVLGTPLPVHGTVASAS